MPSHRKRHVVADVARTQTRRLHAHLASPRSFEQGHLQQNLAHACAGVGIDDEQLSRHVDSIGAWFTIELRFLLSHHPMSPRSLRPAALSALQCQIPEEKVALVLDLYEKYASISIADAERNDTIAAPAQLPGQPEKPTLMAHLNVPQRSIHTPLGLAGLVHSVCHIEFNAINLALDAAWRFTAMPAAYYVDWLRVAAEEAHHFSLLRAQLQSMGHDYGDFPAHTGLWDMVERTQDDIVARMALVPRTLEARGLDATPPMQAKLKKVGTSDALKLMAILDIILRDEVGHVAIGNHWYRWLCARGGLDPVMHFRQLCLQHAAPRVRAPINEEARRMAGFTDDEITELLLNS